MVKHFVVTNPLHKHLHVVLDVRSIKELKTSEHVSQVVPPKSTAKFPIRMLSNEVKGVLQKFEYCINGRHFYTLEASASVVPASLDLSCEEVNFSFDLDAWEPSVQRVMVLRNPQSLPMEYKWEVSSPAFTITPLGGVVPPRFSDEAVFTWTPPANATDENSRAVATLRFVGASSFKKIVLRGELPERGIKFAAPQVDLGDVACAVPQTTTVTLRNAGHREAAFRVLPNPALDVFPTVGRIAVGSTAELQVTLMVPEAGVLATYLDVEPMLGKAVRLPVKATGIVPVCEVLQPVLAVGRTYIGSYSKVPFSIKNPSSVQARARPRLPACPAPGPAPLSGRCRRAVPLPPPPSPSPSIPPSPPNPPPNSPPKPTSQTHLPNSQPNPKPEYPTQNPTPKTLNPKPQQQAGGVHAGPDGAPRVRAAPAQGELEQRGVRDAAAGQDRPRWDRDLGRYVQDRFRTIHVPPHVRRRRQVQGAQDG